MLTKKGGPEVLQVVELPIESPGPGQLRVRVRAAGVGSTDLLMLAGNYRYAPKMPFVPGYEAAGVVEAIGAGGAGFEVGQRVAAFTVYGGFAELLVRGAEHFVPVPGGVSDRDAAAVVLNYVTAWQMIHRVAKVQPGQTALVTGAAGGVGTAALQLLRLAGAKTYWRYVGAEACNLALARRNANRLSGGVDRSPHTCVGTGRRRLRIRSSRRRQHRAVHRRAPAGRNVGGIWFYERARNALPTGHVRQSFRWGAPARTTGEVLRHHHAVPEGCQATARGSAQDLHTPRGEEDRSPGQPHVPAS